MMLLRLCASRGRGVMGAIGTLEVTWRRPPSAWLPANGQLIGRNDGLIVTELVVAHFGVERQGAP